MRRKVEEDTSVGVEETLYPRPNRISLRECVSLVEAFLDERPGEGPLKMVVGGLLDTISDLLGIFDHVHRSEATHHLAAYGDIGDFLCRDEHGHTKLVVDIRDRCLQLAEVNQLLSLARDRGVAEILFLIRGGTDPAEAEQLADLQQRQFTSGHNVYHVEFESLLTPCLILFGEPGRLQFLQNIADRIDTMGDLTDRQAWQQLLEGV